MYRFYVNDKLLHSDNIAELKIFEPQIEFTQNEISTFNFTIYPSNPYIELIKKITSTIFVFQGNELIFRGRPIETEKGTKNALKVYCECDRAFLCDSVQEPYEYEGSVSGMLELLINQHNSQVEEFKQFKLGNVTVTDPNDLIVRSDTQWLTTWKSIKEKLVDMLGGYILIRHAEDGSYIDYLTDLTTLNQQKIKFGENLLTVTKKEDCREIATVLFPLGAKDEETGERLNVSDINDGKMYVENAEAIAKYGRITKVKTWDDVTEPANLLTKGNAELQSLAYFDASIEINAVDMASVNKDISNFKMYSKIGVKSSFHGLDDYFIPLKMTIYPFKQSNNKITLNAERKTLTEDNNNFKNEYGTIVETFENIVRNYQLNIPNKVDVQLELLRQELTSIIEQTSASIKMEVSENYYAIGEEDILYQMQTLLEQTKQGFEMQFNIFSQNITDLTDNTNASFEDIRKYIRFVDGNIELGEVGNMFTLIITKESIEFYENGSKIAYLSNRKLYITFAEVINSLQIGNFAFVPRTNGNLSIKKVG